MVVVVLTTTMMMINCVNFVDDVDGDIGGIIVLDCVVVVNAIILPFNVRSLLEVDC